MVTISLEVDLYLLLLFFGPSTGGWFSNIKDSSS